MFLLLPPHENAGGYAAAQELVKQIAVDITALPVQVLHVALPYCGNGGRL